MISEWIQAGLNLHYFAQNIIFYSSPWDVDTIDQLVGRLDRLRPNGLWKGNGGAHFRNIRIWSIVQPQTPEARIVAALETVSVYQRPLPPLLPEKDQDIRQALGAIVFKNDSQAPATLTELALAWQDNSTTSLLSALSPFSARNAQKICDELQAAALPDPVLKHSDDNSYTARSVSSGAQRNSTMVTTASALNVPSVPALFQSAARDCRAPTRA